MHGTGTDCYIYLRSMQENVSTHNPILPDRVLTLLFTGSGTNPHLHRDDQQDVQGQVPGEDGRLDWQLGAGAGGVSWVLLDLRKLCNNQSSINRHVTYLLSISLCNTIIRVSLTRPGHVLSLVSLKPVMVWKCWRQKVVCCVWSQSRPYPGPPGPSCLGVIEQKPTAGEGEQRLQIVKFIPADHLKSVSGSSNLSGISLNTIHYLSLYHWTDICKLLFGTIWFIASASIYN